MKIADLDCLETLVETFGDSIQMHQIKGAAYVETNAVTYAESSPGSGISAASIDAIALGENTFTSGKMELRTVVRSSYSSSYARADVTAIATSRDSIAVSTSRSRSRSMTFH